MSKWDTHFYFENRINYGELRIGNLSCFPHRNECPPFTHLFILSLEKKNGVIIPGFELPPSDSWSNLLHLEQCSERAYILSGWYKSWGARCAVGSLHSALAGVSHTVR